MLNQMDPRSINEFPYSLNIYLTFLILPGMTVSTSVLMFYFRNRAMRRFIAIELKDWFAKICEKLL